MALIATTTTARSIIPEVCVIADVWRDGDLTIAEPYGEPLWVDPPQGKL